jgi:hypothetical protein
MHVQYLSCARAELVQRHVAPPTTTFKWRMTSGKKPPAVFQQTYLASRQQRLSARLSHTVVSLDNLVGMCLWEALSHALRRNGRWSRFCRRWATLTLWMQWRAVCLMLGNLTPSDSDFVLSNVSTVVLTSAL